MEVYTLDALLRRDELFEDYESLIWTERFKQYGDFELRIASTRRARSLLKAETFLHMNLSGRVMKIESVEETNDDDNRRMLVVKGRTIEILMYDRVAMAALTDTTTNPSWKITGLSAMDAARKIVADICVLGTLDLHDKIPNLFMGSISEASNIPEPTEVIDVEIKPTTVYDALVQLADIYNFGFRILREAETSRLWFDLYMGSDRTTGQSTAPAVILSPQLDNLQNTSQLTTTENAKNVAYVFSPAGFQMVFADEVDGDVEGFERKVMVVTADDVTVDDYPTPTDVANALIRKGKDALSAQQTYHAFDGEMSPVSQYQPGRDYYLGDLVEMQDVDGTANIMRITELIYTSDSEGSRVYPTLTLGQYINTGSWLSSRYNKEWIELESDVETPYWADQP